MKSRLHRIKISSFKAFREFTLDINGRHLLIYGANGSGKSSLYWALYTFLQSSWKDTEDVAKYFDPYNHERLLNIFEQREASPLAGRIEALINNLETKEISSIKISVSEHESKRNPTIEKAAIASDFITYRFFFGFSHFRNSERFNIWPLFEKEILPFCITTGSRAGELDQLWNTLHNEGPNPKRFKGTAGAKAYRTFNARLERFSPLLKAIVSDMSNAAQIFYDQHFSDGDPFPVSLKIEVVHDAYYSKTAKLVMPPVILFGIAIDGREIGKPQSFLNEAKMTQLALSVRFAASQVNLHESDLKLLVLDDLLVSLDMSNRMKVVEILLSDTFESYQKIILTHEMGFFREFKRMIGSGHPDWSFLQFHGSPSASIHAQFVKTDAQKAEEYLHGHSLDEAALSLRKACEDTARRFANSEVLPTKEFIGLAETLRAARNKVLANLPTKLYEKVFRTSPEQHRARLIAPNDDDILQDPTLDPATKGQLIANRKRLRTLLCEEHVERLRQVKLIDDILACTERVLNPAAHSGSPPLYKKEVEDALELVKQLETALES